MTDRTTCSTIKIRTDFGPIFLHVDHDGPRIYGLTFSQHTRFSGTPVGNALGQICDAITEIIMRENSNDGKDAGKI